MEMEFQFVKAAITVTPRKRALVLNLNNILIFSFYIIFLFILFSFIYFLFFLIFRCYFLIFLKNYLSILKQTIFYANKKDFKICHLFNFTIFHIFRGSYFNQGKFRNISYHLSSICFKLDNENECWNSLLDL